MVAGFICHRIRHILIELSEPFVQFKLHLEKCGNYAKTTIPFELAIFTLRKDESLFSDYFISLFCHTIVIWLGRELVDIS
jgi:hypothetical protein